MQRTFIMIKPDGVRRQLVGKIISRFEDKSLRLVGMKTFRATLGQIQTHYHEHIDKPFFARYADFMMSGPLIGMVWEGPEAVAIGRSLIGATNPAVAAPGTIRGDFGLEPGRNLVHGSDSLVSAIDEIGIWFQESELM